MRELLLFAIAAAAGVISGMGMGGGTLLIPALTLLMGIPQRQAQGVNMLSFLPAAAVALYIHKKEGRLELKSSLPVIAAGIGSFWGAGRRLAQGGMAEKSLRIIFNNLVYYSVYRKIAKGPGLIENNQTLSRKKHFERKYLY